jgi:hypothetical protein
MVFFTQPSGTWIGAFDKLGFDGSAFDYKNQNRLLSLDKVLYRLHRHSGKCFRI